MMVPDRLRVDLNDVRVGVLERRNGGSRFVPDPDWAAMPAGRRPVLGLRFEERPWSEVRAGQGLPDWFEHLLPEEGGPLRRAVARGLEVREANSFAIATRVGEDLPGAATLRPDAGAGQRSAAGRRIIEEDDDAPNSYATLRFSLAGMQVKFSARSTEQGLVLGYDGDRIVKLADQRFDEVPTNEHAMMTWARMSGLDVPDTELVPARDLVDLPSGLELRDPLAFVIDRFDRGPSGRVHQEDFAQVLGLSPREGSRDKYEGTNLDSIVNVIAKVAPEDGDELIRRIVFMVLSANNDMHAKNWSLVYPDGVNPRLAPAYDLVCTAPYLDTVEMAFKLSGVLRLDLVGAATLGDLAERAGLDRGRALDVAQDTVRRALAEWADARALAPEPIARFLGEWLETCLLARQLR